MLPDKSFFRKYCQDKNFPWRERDVLREYLQTRILKELSLSEYNDAISFLGGTSLRFLHQLDRYSEDLDFDLVKKEKVDINQLEKTLKKRLERQGLKVDTKVKTTENIHIIYFKFKEVLKEFGFTVPKDEKFVIKFEIDFNPYANLSYESKFVDSFNERFPVFINTLPTLFAQKIMALKFRPYQKGRDFYDLVWFLAQRGLEPNYQILAEKGIHCSNQQELAAELQSIIAQLDLKQAVKDVQRFLFYPDQAKWILDLETYIANYAK